VLVFSTVPKFVTLPPSSKLTPFPDAVDVLWIVPKLVTVAGKFAAYTP